MARLIYSVITSLDGYVADEEGRFDWAAPGEDVHRAVNELEAQVGTYLYGRRMYEVMAVWNDLPGLEQASAAEQEYADIWKSADKIVHSTTLESVATPRTTLESTFDPRAVRAFVAALDSDVSIGGPTLASQALRAGIVDDIHLFTVPVVVGGGTPCWPSRCRLDLALRSERGFADGTVHAHYGLRR
jgi:dihydrofolate reductase